MNTVSIGATLAAAGTQTLAIGAGVSVATTALSVGGIRLGKVIYSKHLNYNNDDWQKAAFKMLGMGLIIASGVLGLVSSVATGAFAAVGLGALGSTILGPIGAKAGLIAGIALGVGSAAIVIVALVKTVKEIKEKKRNDFRLNHQQVEEGHKTASKDKAEERLAKRKADAKKAMDDFLRQNPQGTPIPSELYNEYNNAMRYTVS